MLHTRLYYVILSVGEVLGILFSSSLHCFFLFLGTYLLSRLASIMHNPRTILWGDQQLAINLPLHSSQQLETFCSYFYLRRRSGKTRCWAFIMAVLSSAFSLQTHRQICQMHYYAVPPPAAGEAPIAGLLFASTQHSFWYRNHTSLEMMMTAGSISHSEQDARTCVVHATYHTQRTIAAIYSDKWKRLEATFWSFASWSVM